MVPQYGHAGTVCVEWLSKCGQLRRHFDSELESVFTASILTLIVTCLCCDSQDILVKLVFFRCKKQVIGPIDYFSKNPKMATFGQKCIGLDNLSPNISTNIHLE